MIRERDVFRSKVPYPNVSSYLAQKTHMYICKTSGINKELIKVQSVKTKHKLNGFPTSSYHLFDANDEGNPFRLDSFADLDKNFTLDNVQIAKSLIATPNIDNNNYVTMLLKADLASDIKIDTDEFLTLNHVCSKI